MPPRNKNPHDTTIERESRLLIELNGHRQRTGRIPYVDWRPSLHGPELRAYREECARFARPDAPPPAPDASPRISVAEYIGAYIAEHPNADRKQVIDHCVEHYPHKVLYETIYIKTLAALK